MGNFSLKSPFLHPKEREKFLVNFTLRFGSRRILWFRLIKSLNRLPGDIFPKIGGERWKVKVEKEKWRRKRKKEEVIFARGNISNENAKNIYYGASFLSCYLKWQRNSSQSHRQSETQISLFIPIISPLYATYSVYFLALHEM